MEVQLWNPSQTTQSNPERFIERCARVAYRSEEKMTEDSYKGFLERVVVKNRDHSVCEHAAYVVYDPYLTEGELLRILSVNPLIPWKRIGKVGFKLLINGRQALELSESPFMDPWPILDNLQQYFPTLLAGYDRNGEPLNSTPLYTHPAHQVLNNDSDPNTTLLTFFVKGVSRVTETQWVRHRRMSFTVMSGRGVDVREQEFVMPPTFLPLKEKSLFDWESVNFLVEKARNTYTALRDYHKIPRQDARYLQPQGTSTEMVVSATVTWWNYFWGLRSVKPAQWEIMEASRKTQQLGHELYPQWIKSPPND